MAIRRAYRKGALFFIFRAYIKPLTNVQKKKENIFVQLKRSFHTPYFVMLTVVFVFSFGIANFQATMALFVDHKFSYSPSDIAILLMVSSFVGVIAQTFFVEKLFKWFGEMRVILLNLLVAAIATYLFIFVSGFWLILLITTIFSTATALIRPAVNTLVSKLAGDEQGFAAGMNNAYMSLGNMVGPALAGLLFDWKIQSPYYVGAVILLISLSVASIWSYRKAPHLLKAETHLK